MRAFLRFLSLRFSLDRIFANGHLGFAGIMTSPIDFPCLWEHVIAQFPLSPKSDHGANHWRRVERNGLLLATRTGADVTVVRLFALFHDCRRENEFFDHNHGERGAGYAASLRGKLFELPDYLFSILYSACAGHTEGLHHDDPTIATCWDADRLDLGRVGVIPDPEFMSTAFGREIATFGPVESFLEQLARG